MQVAHRTEPTLAPRRPVGSDVDTRLPRTEAGGGEQAANLDQLHRRPRLSQDPPHLVERRTGHGLRAVQRLGSPICLVACVGGGPQGTPRLPQAWPASPLV